MESRQHFNCGYSVISRMPEPVYNSRTRFVVFVKLLLNMLRDNGEMVLMEQAKILVHHCTRRNRLGDPAYSPLVETTEGRLRNLVGEFRWEIVQAETSLYFANKDSMLRQSRPRGISLRP